MVLVFTQKLFLKNKGFELSVSEYENEEWNKEMTTVPI